MKSGYFIFFTCLLLTIFSFSGKNKFSIDNMDTPPGTIKMSSNLYIDRTEIRILDYLEFSNWTKRVFGSNSTEYISVLPDTTVWDKLGKTYENFSKEYLRNPVFRNYPIVGITFSQAQQFTKWRSDRVMEFLLIRDGIFKHNPTPTKDSFFTIEKYFNGKYGKVSEIEELQYYPVYTLPDSTTYIKALTFSDSLNNYALSHHKKKEDINKIITPYYFENIPKHDTIQNYLFSMRSLPTEIFLHKAIFGEIELFKIGRWYNLIVDLKGNVAELTSTSGITFGGSSMDSSAFANKELFQKNNQPNRYTGFRNMCMYKKWQYKK